METKGINFRVPVSLLKEFTGIREELKKNGAKLNPSTVYCAAMMMFTKATPQERAAWIGRIRNIDLDGIAVATELQDALDAAKPKEMPPAQKRKVAGKH